ncbi:MAG TPA: SRPBCC domain-containing protein [Bryobacteraceae bacterium]|nr:SRPBCC domain-containing protein [Bryobacteraceae bacterium]
MQELPHHLDRTVVIQAKPETVFRFFTDSARWASWWGAGSTIDARPGGKVYIRHANGVESAGEVLEVHAGERIVFTYGFVGGKPIPPGSSRVTIRLEPIEAGTRLHLLHEFAEAAPRDEHVQGWRFQLSLFSNVVANEVYAGAASTVDAWFGAWNIADAPARDEILARIASPGIRFRDRFSLLDGAADLTAHISAAQRFMPGIRLQRKGDVRHCQGTVLADWIAVDSGAQPRMSGTSVFAFRPDGKIDSVTSFTNPTIAS